MIRFDHITHRFGTNVALDDLSFAVNRGELFALLGRNGAGKTTTIRLLVGLLRPSSGDVFVHDRRVHDDPTQTNRYVGYVPDQPQLYDKLTGREFLTFVGQLSGLEGEMLAASIRQQIETFSLAPFVDLLTEKYSHGMKQRTIFAAAFLHQPEVVVVDEPLVGLDPHSIRLVKDLLREYTHNGACVLMSTHTLAAAEEVADRIGILHNGRLWFVGSLDQLRSELDLPGAPLESLYLELIGQAESATQA